MTHYGPMRWAIRGNYRTLQQRVTNDVGCHTEEWQDVPEHKVSDGEECLNPKGEFHAVSSPGMGIVAIFQHYENAFSYGTKTLSYFEIRQVTLPLVMTEGWMRQDGKIYDKSNVERECSRKNQ